LSHHVDEDWREGAVPHYVSRAEAIKDRIAEMRALKDDYDGDDLAKARKVLVASRPTRCTLVCCRLVCDGCELALDHEDELVDPGSTGLHLHADTVTADFLRGRSWTASPDGRTHRCPNCPPTKAELEHEARMPGPDDVPLFPIDGEDSTE